MESLTVSDGRPAEKTVVFIEGSSFCFPFLGYTSLPGPFLGYTSLPGPFLGYTSLPFLDCTNLFEPGQPQYNSEYRQ
jgi:hypothetical protein